jgi:hypothetical protein
MNNSLLQLIIKLPIIITGIMAIVEKFKVPGANKKAVVLAAIPESLELAELLAGRDLLNDPVVKDLISDYIDAEARVINIKNKLRTVLVAREAAAAA